MAASSANLSHLATWRSRPSSPTTKAQVIAADWTGEIRVWDTKDGRRLANLAVNPGTHRRRASSSRSARLAAVEAEAESVGQAACSVPERDRAGRCRR